jgi:hypothetical protein
MEILNQIRYSHTYCLNYSDNSFKISRSFFVIMRARGLSYMLIFGHYVAYSAYA